MCNRYYDYDKEETEYGNHRENQTQWQKKCFLEVKICLDR